MNAHATLSSIRSEKRFCVVGADRFGAIDFDAQAEPFSVLDRLDMHVVAGPLRRRWLARPVAA
jgi:hypothetical protein